ncbi:MAG: LysR family transcriptional regulator [Deltaproteobacteria bacterium]|nr:LysR family transcriptional regulator [Nannocystaceae bacterium]
MGTPVTSPGLFDDLVVFVAVVDAGSVAGAARALGLDASTISRRVARLEETVGVALFHRGGRGMEASERGLRLVRRVRQAMNEVSVGIDESTATEDELSGVVRVTAPTEIGSQLLVPLLREFRQLHPGMTFELELGAHVVSLDQRKADIAVRTHRPTQGDIVSRSLGQRPVRAFHSPELPPHQARLQWLAWSGSDPAVERLVELHPGAQIVLRTNDLTGLRAGCVAGMGTALLHELLVAGHALVPLAGLDPIMQPPLWLAAPTVSLDLPRVRKLWDFLADAFAALPS